MFRWPPVIGYPAMEVAIGEVQFSPENVVAHAEQEPQGVPFGEHAARCARLMATFHGTKLVRGWSWRLGVIKEATSLEFDMFGG
jgi:hypothetical protein